MLPLFTHGYSSLTSGSSETSDCLQKMKLGYHCKNYIFLPF
jgi:hypothetical protein